MDHANALRAWRAANDVTQEIAAQEAGVALSTWRNWETGRVENGPPAAVLTKLEAFRPGLLDLLKSDGSEEDPLAL